MSTSLTSWDFFSTFRKSTGLQADMGSTPTATCYQNGTATADSVTVTKVATGLYKWTTSLSGISWTDGDVMDVVATMTDADAVSETVPIYRRIVHFYSTDTLAGRLPTSLTSNGNVKASWMSSTDSSEHTPAEVAVIVDTQLSANHGQGIWTSGIATVSVIRR